jgi:methionine-rich copper-binding protein CopC
LLGSPIAHAAVAATSIVANVFDGGPRTKVAMTIGGRAPIEMTRQTMPDPFVEEVFARNEATKKPWIKAELSSHMWVARLPADLPPGTHRVVVEAITEYGDAVSGRIALEVTG